MNLNVDFNKLLTVTFTLFAVIDIVGSVPILISLKQKMGGINEFKATLISGGLMILFMFIGEAFLGILGLDISAFAVGGSIVIFILGLEMVLGLEFFKGDMDIKAATVVPIAFPLIAGSGTLTTIMSLRGSNYGETVLLIAILINLAIVYGVLKSLGPIARLLGPAGLIAVRKFFGVILLAIAVKIFATNAPGLIKPPVKQEAKIQSVK
ncbi:MAG: MarC family protein [Chitinophagaceae bacterium]|nr:MarC family protein [Chitinophagaceae bacterium]MBP9103301.1 MarC family protein [Chitinophagaceae bacterium]